MNTDFKHTPEPWDLEETPYETNDKAGGWYLHFGTDGINGDEPLYISRANVSECNAERIVACVNACRGLEDPEADITVAVEALDAALCYMMEKNDDRRLDKERKEAGELVVKALQRLSKR